MQRFRGQIVKTLALCCLCWIMLAPAVFAMDPPKGSVILTLTGNVTVKNGGDKALFDRKMLESFPQKTIVTGSPWTDAPATYEGPLLRDVLAAAGADGETLRVIALNDYAASVPLSDAFDHDTILALVRDGEILRIRDKGPLFLVYPFDDKPELKNEEIYSRSVWQIKAIDIR